MVSPFLLIIIVPRSLNSAESFLYAFLVVATKFSSELNLMVPLYGEITKYKLLGWLRVFNYFNIYTYRNGFSRY